MINRLRLDIITPGKTAFSDVVEQVILPTSSGEITILVGHVPLITEIEPGELQIIKGDTRTYLAIDKGFVRILGDVVSVLTGAAINVNEIDLQTIEAAHKRAEESLAKAKAQKQIQITEVDELESFLRFATAQQLIKKRRK